MRKHCSYGETITQPKENMCPEVLQRHTEMGAGIIGASIAYHLVERGADVTLLDAAEPGSGASGTWSVTRITDPRSPERLRATASAG